MVQSLYIKLKVQDNSRISAISTRLQPYAQKVLVIPKGKDVTVPHNNVGYTDVPDIALVLNDERKTEVRSELKSISQELHEAYFVNGEFSLS